MVIRKRSFFVLSFSCLTFLSEVSLASALQEREEAITPSAFTPSALQLRTLPRDAALSIMRHLDVESLLRLEQTCRRFRTIGESEAAACIWRRHVTPKSLERLNSRQKTASLVKALALEGYYRERTAQRVAPKRLEQQSFVIRLFGRIPPQSIIAIKWADHVRHVPPFIENRLRELTPHPGQEGGEATFGPPPYFVAVFDSTSNEIELHPTRESEE